MPFCSSVVRILTFGSLLKEYVTSRTIEEKHNNIPDDSKRLERKENTFSTADLQAEPGRPAARGLDFCPAVGAAVAHVFTSTILQALQCMVVIFTLNTQSPFRDVQLLNKKTSSH